MGESSLVLRVQTAKLYTTGHAVPYRRYAAAGRSRDKLSKVVQSCSNPGVEVRRSAAAYNLAIGVAAM